jgi:hypothetical protein
VGGVASWEDVRRLAMAMPQAEEPGTRDSLQWKIGGKLFAWERPLRRSDLDALGDAAPEGPILATRVADEGVKHAMVADDPDVYFTIPHFDGYPAVLVRLECIPVDELEELVTEAWLARAPKRAATAYLRDRGV